MGVYVQARGSGYVAEAMWRQLDDQFMETIIPAYHRLWVQLISDNSKRARFFFPYMDF